MILEKIEKLDTATMQTEYFLYIYNNKSDLVPTVMGPMPKWVQDDVAKRIIENCKSNRVNKTLPGGNLLNGF